MTSDLLISGYASSFDEVDLSGDTVRPGAFAASLLERPAPRPMLYGHDTTTPIGVWTRIVEDDVGLYVEGRLQVGDPATARISELIRSGAMNGLSIGYRVRRSTPLTGGRTLLDLDLWEISVVAFPMLTTARITSITPAPTQERIAA